MRRLAAFLCFALALTLCRTPLIAAIGGIVPVSTAGGGCTINSVSLSNNTFTFGSNPAVGTASSSLTGSCAADVWSVSGTDAAHFTINSSTGVLAGSGTINSGTCASGGATCSINIVDTITGATGSPKTQAETLTGSANTTLTSFSLVNTSGSTVSTVISPFIGLQFKKGDIASGAWPKFIRDDTSAACVYSYGLIRTWSDGSLKHMTVVVRCPSTIAGSATLQVDVQTGGTQPTTSARTTTELSAANIQMVAIGSVNLSGTWNSTVADCITNGTNNVWIDGDAGKGWICDGDYKQSGSAHGQLRARWYTFATTDGSGGLGGIRFLSRTWQPYYDLDSPAKNMRAFSTLETCTGVTSTSCSGGVATTIPYPYTAQAFTWNSGNSFAVPSNNYYTGGATNDVVPVVLTTTGTLPTGLSTGTVYFATPTRPGGTNLALETNSNGQGAASASGAGSGTHTMTPTLVVQHFGTIFNATAGTSGQTTSGGEGGYNYVQSAGSLAADATLRFTKDTTYWHATKVLPPWATGLSAGPGVATWSYNWDPVTIGPLDQTASPTGAGPAPLPGEAVLHFFKQDVNGEKVIRVIGMAGANWNVPLRQSSGFAPVNVGNPNNTYTGFATNHAGPGGTPITYGGGATPGGFTMPPAASSSTTWQGNDFSHIPEMAYYPYLWSGEPQYLDVLEEIANAAIFHQAADANHRNPTSPSTAYAITTGLAEQTRENAWQTREVVLAAGISPDTAPDGFSWKAYFVDAATASLAWLNTTVTNTNSYYSTNGYHAFRSFNATVTRTDNSVWQESFVLDVAAWAAALLESTDALTFISHKADWYTHQTASFGDWSRYSFYELPVNNDSTDPITADLQWGGALSGTNLTWTTGTNVFAIDVNTSNGPTINNYVPADGDKVIFTDSGYSLGGIGGILPNGLTAFTPYYMCNTAHVSGTNYTFKFSTSSTPSSSCAGGVVTVTASGSGLAEPTFMVPVTQPSTGTPAGALDEAGYAANVNAATRWSVAACVGNGGATCTAITANMAHTVTDSASRLTSGGVYNCTTSTGPPFCMQSSY